MTGFKVGGFIIDFIRKNFYYLFVISGIINDSNNTQLSERGAKEKRP